MLKKNKSFQSVKIFPNILNIFKNNLYKIHLKKINLIFKIYETILLQIILKLI